MVDWIMSIIEKTEDFKAVEELQRLVWPGNETEIVPLHMLQAIVRNGGLIIGAYASGSQETEATDLAGIDELALSSGPPDTDLIGFVFGFPGLYLTPDGPRLKHCSHMLGVHPNYRDRGIGFALKRAQWQMIRHVGLDRITWTYDPLLSRNAHLNISRLGAVCNTYHRNEYGELRDQLSRGLPTDRFQVDWWINTRRVERRLSKKPRIQLDLAHFLAAGAKIINPTQSDDGGYPRPPDLEEIDFDRMNVDENQKENVLLLVEIPAEFHKLKAADPALGLAWRMHTRALFEYQFARGYLVTDFIFLPGSQSRSFYVLSHGESTL
jgi:predicted GNAT superfamily acetyltransferase